MFASDSAHVGRVVPSPNHGERRGGQKPDILVLHYTGMRPDDSPLDRLTDPRSEVSAHYLVMEDGEIVQMVPEARRAWHAGESFWRGERDVNSRSIGIEIVNPGHNHGLRPFPAVQIDRLIELCRDCVAKWAIPAANVVGHSDIAPSRKEDPGELFPWDQLSAAGIGMTVESVPVSGGRFLSPGDKGDPVAAWQAMLAAYGFDVTADGNYGDTTRLATLAFQRHHRPSLLDGIADTSTVGTMHRLLSRRISEEQDGHLAP
ncbi:N-acetylmuramoyl-L-alanine amidase [Aureimonas altamirensis]|uniref:N-acetylmuramoyl-L-alanine amidase n=1 Tax=Aureimonas altamirensis TaxID=370622 RepID=A0A0B1Q713_9HYPH|nr:N-acetylmuramoyl-L-alanine amidase [Aureimonas altamirensis]